MLVVSLNELPYQDGTFDAVVHATDGRQWVCGHRHDSKKASLICANLLLPTAMRHIESLSAN